MLRTVLLGATGHFGSILARRLRGIPDIELIVAGRNAQRIAASAAAVGVEGVVLDRGDPAFAAKLRDLAPRLVIVTAGPFQSQDYAVPRAAIAAGAHYIDIADGRDFVCGIRALHAEALERGVCVLSGASSVPALSGAVVERLAEGLDGVDAIDIGISTSSRSPGEATLRAVLGYCGRPIAQWRDGKVLETFGSEGGWRRTIEGAGVRWFCPCDVPDLTLLRERFPGLRSLRFGAGSELRVVRAGMGWIAAAVRAGVIRDAASLAPMLGTAARLLAPFGTGRSAMYVDLSGTTGGSRARRTWELVASSEDGANIPCIAAVCLARKLAAGTPEARGAFPASGRVTLDEYLREMQDLNIRVRMEEDA